MIGAEVMGVIRLIQVTKRYGTTTALDGVDLHVAPGETLGLLGPNGAGKTTTLRLLAGMAAPTSGRVQVMGVDPWEHPERVRAQIGVVPDQGGLFDRLTVGENLRLFAALHGVRPAEVKEASAAAGLEGLAGRPVRGLSRGERQRVALARALLHQPRLLVLDEPTAGLDPAATLSFHQLLRGLKARGRTVVIASHDMAEVEALCDRVAILDRGRLVACDSPAALKSRYGRRTVRVTFASGAAAETAEWPLEDAAWVEAVTRRQAEGSLLAVDTHEASLAEVFLHTTGRELT